MHGWGIDIVWFKGLEIVDLAVVVVVMVVVGQLELLKGATGLNFIENQIAWGAFIDRITTTSVRSIPVRMSVQ